MLATRVSGKMHDGPGGTDMSRQPILEQADASPRRLDTDYVDVYYIHQFDPATPVEETMQTLDDLVGTARAVTSARHRCGRWRFAKAQRAAVTMSSVTAGHRTV